MSCIATIIRISTSSRQLSLSSHLHPSPSSPHEKPCHSERSEEPAVQSPTTSPAPTPNAPAITALARFSAGPSQRLTTVLNHSLPNPTPSLLPWLVPPSPQSLPSEYFASHP